MNAKTNPGTRSVIDLGAKLVLILRDKGFTRYKIKSELAKFKFKGKRRTPNTWFDDGDEKENTRVNLHQDGCDKIVGYLMEQHRIDFKDTWFDIPLEEFKSILGIVASSYIKNSINVGVSEIWPDGDTRTPALLKALAGTYQIIRPSSAKRGNRRYVLEAVAIESDEKKRQAEILMYSHTEPSSEFIYHSQLFVSYKYAYALIRRKHEQNPERLAMRELSFYVGDQPIFGPPATCWSGMVLRGVSGTTGASRMIGAPIIALKTESDASTFKMATFTELIKNTRRLSKDSHTIIGEINDKNTRLFRFCDNLFSNLGRKLLYRRIISTVLVEDITAVVQEFSGIRKKSTAWSISSVWSKVVKDTLGK